MTSHTCTNMTKVIGTEGTMPCTLSPLDWHLTARLEEVGPLLTVSSVQMECTWVPNITDVKMRKSSASKHSRMSRMTVVGGEKELHSARKATRGLSWLPGSLLHPNKLPPCLPLTTSSPGDWAQLESSSLTLHLSAFRSGHIVAHDTSGDPASPGEHRGGMQVQKAPVLAWPDLS